MSYFLGIDLGTTYTAAAVHDGSPRRGPEVVTLGERGPTAPSVLHLQPDGSYVAGDAAERHAVTDPERIARQFKRRLGDPTPLLVGGNGVPAEVLTGHLLRWVVDTVVRSRGGAEPAAIALTHPANWGPYKRDLLGKAAEMAGVAGVVHVTEPQAAAISYASHERVDEGAIVAVYDLGGGTFDAAVLRKEADGGFTVLGTPEGIERLGGIDVDAAVFARVTAAVADAYEALDPDDPQALAAVSRLRIDCTQAKEGLSLDNEIQVPVLLPTIQTEVRVTRTELEDMIRPTLAETVTALERALRSASVAPAEVDHVLLVGGSSRIPLVAQLVSSGLGRPVAVDAHPKHAVALGAAIVAARAAGALAPPSATTAPPPGQTAPPPGPPAQPVYAAPAPPSHGAPAPPPAPPVRPVHAAPAPPPPPTSPSPPARPAPPPAPSRPPAPPGAPAAPPPGGARPVSPAGYRAGAAPPPPGSSDDLPPGYLTGDARATRRRSARRKRVLGGVVAVVAIVGGLLAYATLTAGDDTPATVGDVEVGECFNGNPNELDTVACTEPHQFELFHVAAAPDPAAAFPGADKVREDGGSTCLLALVDYYGASADQAAADGLDLDPVTPSEAQWNAGETDTFCLARRADGAALDSSIKGQGAAG
ncbi:MAG TPA: Hsp70 family protein [Acidimicrobiales bacterium]